MNKRKRFCEDAVDGGCVFSIEVRGWKCRERMAFRAAAKTADKRMKKEDDLRKNGFINVTDASLILGVSKDHVRQVVVQKRFSVWYRFHHGEHRIWLSREEVRRYGRERIKPSERRWVNGKPRPKPVWGSE